MEDNDNYDEVKRVYEGDRSKIVRVDEIQDGSLIIFSGRYSLHRVIPVIGFNPRINAILTYERK